MAKRSPLGIGSRVSSPRSGHVPDLGSRDFYLVEAAAIEPEFRLWPLPWERCSSDCAHRAAIRGGPPTTAAGRLQFVAVLAELLPVLLELLDILLQLGRVARRQVGFDGLPIGLEFLTGLLLLAIVVLQGLAILAQVA